MKSEIEKALSGKAKVRVSSTSTWKEREKKTTKTKKPQIPVKFSFKEKDIENIKRYLSSKPSDFEVEVRIGYFQKVFPKTRGKRPWWKFDSNIKSGYSFSLLYKYLLERSGGVEVFEDVETTRDVVRTISSDFFTEDIRAITTLGEEEFADYQQKSVFPPVDNIDWGVRISKASEEFLGEEEGQLFEETWSDLLKEWKSVSDTPPTEYILVGEKVNKEEYSRKKTWIVMTERHRYRNSFLGQEDIFSDWRIDLTRVSETYYRRDGSTFSMTKYEVEIERTGRTNYDSLFGVVETVLKVLQNVTDTSNLMSLPERRLATTLHNDLFWAYIKMDRWYQGTDKYRLYKNYWNRPRNIKLSDMLHSKFNPAVTIKLDGVRRFVYFTDKGIYMYGAPYDVYKIGAPYKDLVGTFIDCEFMDDEGQELFAFDILFWKGENVMSSQFRSRLEILENIQIPEEVLWNINYVFKQYFGVEKKIKEKKPQIDQKKITKLMVLSDIVRDYDYPSIENQTQDLVEKYILHISKKERLDIEEFESGVENLLSKARSENILPSTRDIEGMDEILDMFSHKQTPQLKIIVQAYKKYIGGKKYSPTLETLSENREKIEKLLKNKQKRLRKRIKKIISKHEEIEPDVRTTFYQRVAEALEVSEEKFSGRTDGLIFQPWGPYANKFTFKWKPPEKLTIDFLFERMTAKEKKLANIKKSRIAFKLMVISDEKRDMTVFTETIGTETIGTETLSLRMPKGEKGHPLEGKDVRITAGAYKGHTGLIVAVEKKGIRVQLFTTGVNILIPRENLRLTEDVETTVMSPSGLTQFVGSSNLQYPGYIVLRKKDITHQMDGAIFECSWSKKKEEFKIQRLRVDRDKPNNLRTALDVWYDIMNPISEETILGNTLQLARKLANKGKSDLLLSNFDKGDIILDIGSGRGGDLRKWSSVGFSRVYVVEPDEENLEELTSRRENMNIETDIVLLNYGAEKTLKIEKALSKKGDVLNGIVAFYSLTFFPSSRKMYQGLLNTLSLLPDGGKFVGIVMDGNRTRELLEEHDGMYESPAFTLTQESEITDETIGNEIEINITDPTSMVKDLKEWLFYFHDFRENIEKLGFVLEEENFLDEIEGYDQLSENAQEFTRLNRKFVFTRASVRQIELKMPREGEYRKLGKLANRVLYYSEVPGHSYLGGVLEAVGDRLFEDYSDYSFAEKNAAIMKLREEWADLVDMKTFSKLYGGRLKKLIEKKFGLESKEALEKYRERLADPTKDVGEAYLLALISHFLKIDVFTLRFLKNQPLEPFTILDREDCDDFYDNDESVILVTADMINFYLVSVVKKDEKVSVLPTNSAVVKSIREKMCQ